MRYHCVTNCGFESEFEQGAAPKYCPVCNSGRIIENDPIPEFTDFGDRIDLAYEEGYSAGYMRGINDTEAKHVARHDTNTDGHSANTGPVAAENSNDSAVATSTENANDPAP